MKIHYDEFDSNNEKIAKKLRKYVRVTPTMNLVINMYQKIDNDGLETQNEHSNAPEQDFWTAANELVYTFRFHEKTFATIVDSTSSGS